MLVLSVSGGLALAFDEQRLDIFKFGF